MPPTTLRGNPVFLLRVNDPHDAGNTVAAALELSDGLIERLTDLVDTMWRLSRTLNGCPLTEALFIDWTPDYYGQDLLRSSERAAEDVEEADWQTKFDNGELVPVCLTLDPSDWTEPVVKDSWLKLSGFSQGQGDVQLAWYLNEPHYDADMHTESITLPQLRQHLQDFRHRGAETKEAE